MSGSTTTKSANLEIPSAQPSARLRPSPIQRFPSTALFQGPHSRNASHHDLSSAQGDFADPQRLPRPQAAPSLSGPSVRPSIVKLPTVDRHPSSQTQFSSFTLPDNRKDAFQPEALWAEMQRTLADVELSALDTSSSSHVFSASHSRALEELRKVQVNLAQSWARSEADQLGDSDTDDSMSKSELATVRKVGVLTASPSKSRARAAGNSDDTAIKSEPNANGRARASSTASNGSIAQDLEAETERDIQMARKRREANDRYFQQVNQGVLDVVAKLDEVAMAMKQVERESREVWSDASVSSFVAKPGRKQRRSVDKSDGSGTDDARSSELDRMLTRTTATTTTTLDTKLGTGSSIDSGTETEGLTNKSLPQERRGNNK